MRFQQLQDPLLTPNKCASMQPGKQVLAGKTVWRVAGWGQCFSAHLCTFSGFSSSSLSALTRVRSASSSRFKWCTCDGAWWRMAGHGLWATCSGSWHTAAAAARGASCLAATCKLQRQLRALAPHPYAWRSSSLLGACVPPTPTAAAAAAAAAAHLAPQHICIGHAVLELRQLALQARHLSQLLQQGGTYAP